MGFGLMKNAAAMSVPVCIVFECVIGVCFCSMLCVVCIRKVYAGT